MESRFFGEQGSRKRKIWIGIGAFITLMIVYQMGYNSGTRSMLGALEHLAAVPQDCPAAHSQRELQRVALPPVPAFSSVLPSTGTVPVTYRQPPGGGTIKISPAEPCRCGKVH